MGMYRCFPAFLFILLSVSPGWTLTLTEALSLAASHPAILEGQFTIEQADSMVGDAGKRGPDSISVEAENVSGRLPGLSMAEITASFKRPIPDRNKTRAQKRLANLSVDSAKLDLRALKRDISYRVQTAFHKVIGLQNLYRNAQELSRINLDMFEATKARVEAGASPEQEVVKAQLDIDRVEVERKNIEGQLAEAMLNLYREMGVTENPLGEAVGTLTPDIELPEIEKLQQQILDIHPAFLSVSQSLKENDARLDLLKAENRPAYAWAAGARNFREDRSHAYVFAIEAELPNRRANQGARRAAQKEKDKIETAREKAQRELFTALQELVKRFQRNRETVLSLRNQILPSAQKALEITLDGYRLGKTDQLVVLEARKAYAEVARQSLTALTELFEAVDAIEQLTGVCLVGEHH